jgi:general secretion pathway protein C
LRRNIFDSETGDLTAQPVVATADPEEPIVVDPNAPPPPCEGSIRLVAALVNARHPEWSFASIAGPDGKALLYRAGMSIEGREIMGIGSSQVFMRPSSGSLCTLAMFAPPQTGESPRVAAAPATPAAVVRRGGEEEGGDDGSISSADMEAGINRVSDTEFTVARGLVDQLLDNQAELMRTARIIPHQEGGRTVGVKLYGIRRNSLLGRLGLQNGDMMRTINGYDMTSPDSALEAYSRLRGANNLTVAVVRRGQAMNIDYNIQ